MKSYFFVEKSNQIPDRPILSLVVLAPDKSMEDKRNAFQFIETMTREYGRSGRTFKSALIWCVPESSSRILDEARRVLACEDVDSQKDDLGFDEEQTNELTENLKKSRRDLRESVWQTYKNVVLLDKENQFETVDVGLNHSSAAESMTALVLRNLRESDDVADSMSPRTLLKNWPPALPEWSTKSVRDAVYASPKFSRLLNPESIKETIAKGVREGFLAYVGRTEEGTYNPFLFKKEMSPNEVEICDDAFIITADEAKKHIEPPRLKTLLISPERARIEPGKKQTFQAKGLDQHGRDMKIEEVRWSATGGTIDEAGVLSAGTDEGSFVVTATVGEITGSATFDITEEGEPPPPPPPPPTVETRLAWTGQLPSQKWMNFYTKVLSRFATEKGLRLTVGVEVTSDKGIPPQKVEETKTALRELGLDDDVEVK